MASKVSPELQRLLAERKLMRASISKGMILKELEAARNDLRDSKDSLDRRKFKWTTIQAYYSMFHSARALARKLGLLTLCSSRIMFESFVGRVVFAAPFGDFKIGLEYPYHRGE